MPEIIDSPETINITAAEDLVFSTGGVERARIHQDGTGAGLFSGSRPAPAPAATALPNPCLVYHRGLPNMVPEDTREGIKAAIAAGATVVKIDAEQLKGGAFGCMHDDTIDRTTTGSGNCADQTSASWQNLSIDQGVGWGGAYVNYLTPPLIADLITDFAGQVTFFIEAKRSGTGQALAQLIAAKGAQRYCIYQTSFWSDVQYGPANGLVTAFVDAAGTTKTPAQLAAAGVSILVVDVTNAAVTQSLISSMHAVGIKVHGYTPVRQSDVATFIDSKGGDGVHSDDALYAFGRKNNYSYLLTTDYFKSQSFYHGHLASAAGNRGIWTSPDEWGFAETVANGYKGCLIGGLSPIKSTPAARSFTLDFSIDFQAVAGGDTTRWAGGFLAPDDYQFSDNGSKTGVNGYRFLLSAAGTLGVYRYTDGVSAASNTFASTALSLPQSVHCQVIVDATSVTLKRLDTGASVALTDNLNGAGYINLGVSGSTARFKSITVS